jgi:hypothetical protein
MTKSVYPLLLLAVILTACFGDNEEPVQEKIHLEFPNMRLTTVLEITSPYSERPRYDQVDYFYDGNELSRLSWSRGFNLDSLELVYNYDYHYDTDKTFISSPNGHYGAILTYHNDRLIEYEKGPDKYLYDYRGDFLKSITYSSDDVRNETKVICDEYGNITQLKVPYGMDILEFNVYYDNKYNPFYQIPSFTGTSSIRLF